MTDGQPEPEGVSSPSRAAWLLFLVALLVYNVNLRTITAGDNYPTRFLPFALWGHGTVTLDPVREAAGMGRPDAFWLVKGRTGALMSRYPVVLPVLVSPFYAPAVAYLSTVGWTERRVFIAGEAMEKLLASSLAAAGAALLLLLLRRRVSLPQAAFLAAVYAFSTNTWVTSSQGLWQHTVAQVLYIGILYLVVRGKGGTEAALIGLLSGLFVMNRPFDALLIAPLLGVCLIRRPRTAIPGLAGFLAGALPFLAYNQHYFGNPAGYYAVLAMAKPQLHNYPFAESLSGLWISPSKGLLVFSPVFLFLALRRRRSGPPSDEASVDGAVIAGVVLHVLLFSMADFRAGSCYGPRFLVDALPGLTWLLSPVPGTLRGPARAAFVAAVLWGLLVQGIGAFRYPLGGSDGRDPWDWKNPAFLVEARATQLPPKLAILP